MKRSKKVVSLLLSASMMAALISGCGSSSGEGSTGSTTTPKAQKKDIGANGVPGVDDAALADMLVEAASDPLYSEICVSEIILPKWIQEIGKIKKCAFAV